MEWRERNGEGWGAPQQLSARHCSTDEVEGMAMEGERGRGASRTPTPPEMGLDEVEKKVKEAGDKLHAEYQQRLRVAEERHALEMRESEEKWRHTAQREKEGMEEKLKEMEEKIREEAQAKDAVLQGMAETIKGMEERIRREYEAKAKDALQREKEGMAEKVKEIEGKLQRRYDRKKCALERQHAHELEEQKQANQRELDARLKLEEDKHAIALEKMMRKVEEGGGRCLSVVSLPWCSLFLMPCFVFACLPCPLCLGLPPARAGGESEPPGRQARDCTQGKDAQCGCRCLLCPCVVSAVLCSLFFSCVVSFWVMFGSFVSPLFFASCTILACHSCSNLSHTHTPHPLQEEQRRKRLDAARRESDFENPPPETPRRVPGPAVRTSGRTRKGTGMGAGVGRDECGGDIIVVGEKSAPQQQKQQLGGG